MQQCVTTGRRGLPSADLSRLVHGLQELTRRAQLNRPDLIKGRWTLCSIDPFPGSQVRRFGDGSCEGAFYDPSQGGADPTHDPMGSLRGRSHLGHAPPRAGQGRIRRLIRTRSGCPSVSRGSSAGQGAQPAQPLAAECPRGPLFGLQKSNWATFGESSKDQISGYNGGRGDADAEHEHERGRAQRQAQHRCRVPRHVAERGQVKTKDNENIKTETIEQAYERVFGAAVEEAQRASGRERPPERQIRDYLAKVRAELDADEKKRASGDKWRKNRP